MKFDESLLTAYLDGELSEEERAVVERQLAQNAAHRETLRQLTRVHQQLAALPAESFATDVVAGVRRRIAAGHGTSQRVASASSPATDQDASAAAEGEAAADRPIPRDRSDVGRPLSWHLWIPLALAAGLLAVVGFFLLRRPVEVALSERAASEAPAPQRDGRPEPASPPQSDSFAGEPLDTANEAAAPGRGRSRRSEPARSLTEPLAEQRAETLEEEAPAEAAERLPEGTRLYRYSADDREVSWWEFELPPDDALDRSSLEFSSPASSAAPRFTFEVPAGEVAAMLHWITNQLGAGEDVSEPTAESRANADASSAAERPAAVLVEAPPEQIGQLLRSVRRRITQRYGISAEPPAARDTTASDELAEGAALIIIEPADGVIEPADGD